MNVKLEDAKKKGTCILQQQQSMTFFEKIRMRVFGFFGRKINVPDNFDDEYPEINEMFYGE